MIRFFHVIGLVALCVPAFAGENIVLRTGFLLTADRHEVDGPTIRIFSNGGVTEMPANLVDRVETIPAETAKAPEAAANSTQAAPVVPTLASASVNQTPAEMAEAAASKYALPAAFVAGVMRAESGFNPTAVSPKGAIGLMQLMPETARDLGIDPKKPAENAEAGTRYLRDLLEKYQDRPDQVVLALAAYNAGPAAVDKYHGVPPYRETREYILRVLKAWNPMPAAR
jgi:soluble lytic murein transglycosylase-like protein